MCVPTHVRTSPKQRLCDMAAQGTAPAMAQAAGSVSVPCCSVVLHMTSWTAGSFTARDTYALTSSQTELCNNREAVKIRRTSVDFHLVITRRVILVWTFKVWSSPFGTEWEGGTARGKCLRIICFAVKDFKIHSGSGRRSPNSLAVRVDMMVFVWFVSCDQTMWTL